jgi:hypothetical protein
MEGQLSQIRDRLEQDRTVSDFRSYTASDAFRERQRTWPSQLKMARSEWWRHSRYHTQPMMPEYHVHFREESAHMLAAILDSYQHYRAGNVEKRNKKILLASRTFEASMSTLSFHVAIEERRVFPMMQSEVPDVDLSFLYADHEELHKAEAALKEALARCQDVCSTASGDGDDDDDDDDDGDDGDGEKRLESLFQELVDRALAFDTIFMNHLGEEEELVVPLSLHYTIRM